MPTYEYRCKGCGHELEVVQAFTDDALTTCERCGEARLRKVFAAPGIAFKGSGFYKTDSRGKSASTAGASSSSSSDTSGGGDKASSSSDSSSTSNGTSDSSSSTKPASAPATKPA